MVWLALVCETAPSVDGLVAIGDDLVRAHRGARDGIHHLVRVEFLAYGDGYAGFLVYGGSPRAAVALTGHVDAPQRVDEGVEAQLNDASVRGCGTRPSEATGCR